jgi:hypothetical protein
VSRTGPFWWKRIGSSEMGRLWKRSRRVNTVQKFVHIYVNTKVIPIESIPGMERGVIKEIGGGCEFNYDIFDTL